MFIHPVWPLFRPLDFEFPKFEFKGTSSYKYEEDNDVITYTITVPDNVSEDDIEASVKQGVLTLKLPKLAKCEDGSCKIKIKGV
jgi:HSP20 family molecular chaperone IbpA